MVPTRRAFAFSLASASLSPALAAEPCDWLLSAGTVVTMDAQRRIVPDGALAISGNKILAAGPRAELAARFKPRRTLARPNAILIPGLINTHAHCSMSLLRGVADDRRLQDWLENFIFPAEAKNVTAPFCFDGALYGAAEMALSGTTCYVDMYYFEEEVARATRQVGIRGVLGQTVIGFPVADAKTPADALTRTEAFFKTFANDDLIIPAVAPHALYTNSRESLTASRALANRYRRPLVIHVSETRKENDDMRNKYGKSPVQTLAEWGIFDGPTIAAHVIWVDEEDIRTLARHKVGIAHCPSSNMKLASGIAPVAKQLAAGLHVGLGTDGPAGSNNDFHLLEELDLAAKLAKVAAMDPQVLPAQTVLEMATLHGAAIIGRQADLGSLEAGKLADCVFVRTDVLHAQPLYDPYSAIAYALKSSDITDVFVGGKAVVRGGELVNVRQAELLAKAAQYRKQIVLSLQKK